MSRIDEATLFAPVSELSESIRTRKLSPVELTEAYLQRIEHWGGKLNAVARATPDLARRQAKQAEDEINRGRYRGPLHGIPYGAKDLFATAGIATEWGAGCCAGQMFDRDATVVTRLREAGAVLLGKLAMIEFAGGLGYRYANASATGPARNPWGPNHWTGGSSSGSGGAVAGGLVGFALGTETWGSILCPSAFCGTTGLRPSYGRVSRAGAMVCSNTYDKVGPIARSARDCRLILQAIAGRDPVDPSSSAEPVKLAPGSSRRITELRGALVPLDFSKSREPEAKQAFDHAVSECRAMGLKLEEAKLPEFPTGEVASVIITAEALSAFERFHRDGSVAKLHDPYAPHQWEISQAITSDDLVKAWRMRRVAQQKMAEFFADYDVVVTPNFLTTAPRVEEDINKALDGYTDPVGGLGNTCGLPSLALPSGTGRGGLPLGFQFVAAPFEEALLLDLGEAFQARTKFHTAHPVMTG
jgi:aspartyl-tRNA(Asn)/glutamyl-tRNA(Gln) amidotransferase subunit A